MKARSHGRTGFTFCSPGDSFWIQDSCLFSSCLSYPAQQSLANLANSTVQLLQGRNNEIHPLARSKLEQTSGAHCIPPMEHVWKTPRVSVWQFLQTRAAALGSFFFLSGCLGRSGFAFQVATVVRANIYRALSVETSETIIRKQNAG